MIAVELVSDPATLVVKQSSSGVQRKRDFHSQMTHAFRDDVTVRHWLFRRVSVVKEALEESRFLCFFGTTCVDLGTRLIDTSTDELETQSAKPLHVEITPLLPPPLSYQSRTAASTDC